jgi:hypothetical protein
VRAPGGGGDGAGDSGVEIDVDPDPDAVDRVDVSRVPLAVSLALVRAQRR